VDFVPMHEEIVTSYLEGTTQEVTLHDGSVVRLQKTGSDHDPRDRNAALAAQMKALHEGEILTGLLYIDPEAEETHDFLHTSTRPLNTMVEKDLCPGGAMLDLINASFR
jgi:2-oxoglutarate ferredoxin oxidoreductase subunit beta